MEELNVVKLMIILNNFVCRNQVVFECYSNRSILFVLSIFRWYMPVGGIISQSLRSSLIR